MKTQTLKLHLLIIMSICTSHLPRAQSADVQNDQQTASQIRKSQFIVELDPLPYILGGGGGHLGWTPLSSKHFTFGLGFVIGPEFPEPFVEMDKRNKDEGWSLKVNQGAGVWVQYYLREPNEGWFTGLQVFTQEMELQKDEYPDQSDRTNVLMGAVQAGYVWYPLNKVNLYLRPWAGFGIQKTIKATFDPDEVDPEMRIEDREYYLASFLPFATFHIGYAFR